MFNVEACSALGDKLTIQVLLRVGLLAGSRLLIDWHCIPAVGASFKSRVAAVGRFLGGSAWLQVHALGLGSRFGALGRFLAVYVPVCNASRCVTSSYVFPPYSALGVRQQV